MDDLREKRLAAFDAALKELVATGAVTSVSDWCDKAGMSSSGTVYDFLSGKSRLMSDRTLTRLCAPFGKTLAWIKGEQSPTDARIQHAMDLLASLPDQAQEEFLAMLEGRVMLHRRKS